MAKQRDPIGQYRPGMPYDVTEYDESYWQEAAAHRKKHLRLAVGFGIICLVCVAGAPFVGAELMLFIIVFAALGLFQLWLAHRLSDRTRIPDHRPQDPAEIRLTSDD